MPIPLIIWAIAAVAGTAVVAANWRKIEEFFNSEDGQKLLKTMNDVTEGVNAPHKEMLDRAFVMGSDERKLFFKAAKQRMDAGAWGWFIGFVRNTVESERQLKYLPAWIDLQTVDNED